MGGDVVVLIKHDFAFLGRFMIIPMYFVLEMGIFTQMRNGLEASFDLWYFWNWRWVCELYLWNLLRVIHAGFFFYCSDWDLWSTYSNSCNMFVCLFGLSITVKYTLYVNSTKGNSTVFWYYFPKKNRVNRSSSDPRVYYGNPSFSIFKDKSSGNLQTFRSCLHPLYSYDDIWTRRIRCLLNLQDQQRVYKVLCSSLLCIKWFIVMWPVKDLVKIFKKKKENVCRIFFFSSPFFFEF